MKLRGSRSVLRRLGPGAVALVAGAGVVCVAPPAHAETASADVQVTVAGDRVVTLASKQFVLKLYNAGPATAEKIVVKVDVAGLDQEKLEVEPPSGTEECAVDGTLFTCAIGNLVAGEHDNTFSPFTITSLEGEGPAGSFTVEVTAETADPNPDNNKKTTVPVEVVPVGYDLAVHVEDVWGGPATDGTERSRVDPGKRANLEFFLTNEGVETAEGVTWKITLPSFVTFPADEKTPGCVFNDARTVATCEQPGTRVSPGDVFILETPMVVEVAKDAPGPVALTGGMVDGGSISRSAAVDTAVAAEATRTATGGSATVAEPTPEQQRMIEADPRDNVAEFSVHTSVNPADLSITGGSATDTTGATVTIAVKIKNAGPASSPATTVTITAPTGTELVNLPVGCVFTTAGSVAACKGPLMIGQEATLTFSFKIKSATVGANGKAEIAGSLEDKTLGNNSAALTITVSAGLPITGANVAVLGGIGLAALAVGIVLMLFSHRLSPRRRDDDAVVPANRG